MMDLNKITAENFDSSFSIADILSESVYYPASGDDSSDIKCLVNYYNSFVHVDYSFSRNDIEEWMMNGLTESFGPDSKLIGMKFINKNELTPNGFRSAGIEFNQHEKERLEMDFIRDLFYCRNFRPFALWAVYEISTENGSTRFSLLHIGGEACATLEALYLTNKINPAAVAIIHPAEGFGDNWTLFRDPGFRFYKIMEKNALDNGASMPRYVLTDMIYSDEHACFWPEYKFDKKCEKFDRHRLYGRK
jgi:hypothetical protein